MMIQRWEKEILKRIVLSVLAIILMMGMTGCSSSTNENSSQQTEEQTTENAKIMQQVGRAFIYWVEKHPEYKNSTIKNNVPWNEIFEKYISFK